MVTAPSSAPGRAPDTAARETGRCFDLVIADEAHHCAGPWSAPWTALARYGSRDDIPARRRLFLTATPRLHREGDYTAHNAAMDDPAAFGHVLYQLPLPQAIRLGLLSDYQVAVVGVTHQQWSTLTSAAGSQDLHPLNGRMPYVLAKTGSPRQITIGPRMLAATFALGRAMTRYQLRRVLTFHARIRDAKAYAAAAPGLLFRIRHPDGPRCVTASAVYADMPSERRAEMIRKFDDADEAHAVIVSNVRCLSEGIDVPALDAVVFADPRRGLVDVVQAVGRVMRPHPGKAAGIVVLPVVLPDHASRVGQPGGGAGFTDLIHVLRALREHDTALAAQLDELRQAAGRRAASSLLAGPLSAGGPLRLMLPRGLPDSFIGAFTLRLLAGTTAPWHERYGALRQWAITHGHSNVPVAEVFDGIRLGGWVHEQRSLKARGLLASSRRDKLEQLPGWEWTPRDAAWERAFRLLIDYVDGHGTSSVPQTYRVSNFALGAWVKAQRELQLNGRLPRYREHKLATLPGWYWRSPRSTPGTSQAPHRRHTGLVPLTMVRAGLAAAVVPRFHGPHRSGRLAGLTHCGARYPRRSQCRRVWGSRRSTGPRRAADGTSPSPSTLRAGPSRPLRGLTTNQGLDDFRSGPWEVYRRSTKGQSPCAQKALDNSRISICCSQG